MSIKTTLRAAFAAAALAAFATAAPAQEPAPAHVAAAREMMLASGVARSFEAIIPQMMVRLEQSLTQTRPEIAKDLGAVLESLDAEFSKNQEEILATAARIAARKMTEAEIRDTLAFFNSASGKKYVASQPQMLDELVVAIQGWTEKLSQTMLGRVREEMKKKGHEL
ncbi:MAG: DUF2059 domain-containing protein [Methylobacteriaceae bacterium]|nr:DUF2059 domain-containing protein [Methylobacteriaceae bacterium]